MKISKIRPKFHFLTKTEIKISPLLVLFCYLLPFFFLSHFEAVLSTLRFLVVQTTISVDKTNVKVEKQLLIFIKQLSNLKYKCRI